MSDYQSQPPQRPQPSPSVLPPPVEPSTDGYNIVARIVGLVGALVVAVVVWFALTVGGDGSIVDTERTFPTIGAVLDAFGEMVSGEELGRDSLWTRITTTVGSFVGGFVGGLVLGGLVGGALGWNDWLRSFLDPLAAFFRMIAPLPVAALVIVWFGIGTSAVMWTTVLVTAWIVAGEVAEGLTRHRRGQAAALGGEVADRLRFIAFVAWWSTLCVEFFAGRSGLGSAVLDSRNFLRVDLLVANLIIIGLVGLMIDSAVRLVGSAMRLSNKPS